MEEINGEIEVEKEGMNEKGNEKRERERKKMSKFEKESLTKGAQQRERERKMVREGEIDRECVRWVRRREREFDMVKTYVNVITNLVKE